jgi:hypothetical protein
MAEIRKYSMNFGFGRYCLTFREREKLAYAEVHRTDFTNG